MGKATNLVEIKQRMIIRRHAGTPVVIRPKIIRRKGAEAGSLAGRTFRYRRQAAMSLGGLNALAGKLELAIERDPARIPDAVARWRLARDLCDRALEMYAHLNHTKAALQAAWKQCVSARGNGSPGGAGMHYAGRAA